MSQWRHECAHGSSRKSIEGVDLRRGLRCWDVDLQRMFREIVEGLETDSGPLNSLLSLTCTPSKSPPLCATDPHMPSFIHKGRLLMSATPTHEPQLTVDHKNHNGSIHVPHIKSKSKA